MRAGSSRNGAFNVTGGTGLVVKIGQWGVPFIKASSGTMGNNGALTALTALPRTYNTPGAYIWLPAAAISAGSTAGWYWFVGSSTTAGTVYNSTYSSGVPVVGTQTAFVTTGPGAFTGSTAAVTGPVIAVPGNTVTIGGRLTAFVGVNETPNANNKTWVTKIGSSTALTQIQSTGTALIHVVDIFNEGATGNQFCAGYVSNIGSQHNFTTEDTTTALNVSFLVTTAVATDNAIFEGGYVSFIS